MFDDRNPGTSRLPAEVVQLVTDAGDVGPANHLTVGLGVRVHIEDGHRVVALRGPIEGDDASARVAGGRCPLRSLTAVEGV
jgi:hypothetical protein